MATKQKTEITDLASEVKKLRVSLQQGAFEASTGKTKNVHALRAIRKNIARALTKIHHLSYKHV